MSWESTVSYYQQINRLTNQRLGGLHSAKILINSVDFAEIETLQHSGDWDKTANILREAALSLQRAGADCLLICTNTMHKVAEEITEGLTLPLLHIADATGDQLVKDNVTKVGLLGTRFTMEQTFYTARLKQNFGLEVITPTASQREEVHNVIYQQLCKGIIDNASRERYLNIIADMQSRGAQAIILGCTEIALLIQQKHTAIPLYDTTKMHAEAAVAFALC